MLAKVVGTVHQLGQTTRRSLDFAARAKPQGRAGTQDGELLRPPTYTQLADALGFDGSKRARDVRKVAAAIEDFFANAPVTSLIHDLAMTPEYCRFDMSSLLPPVERVAITKELLTTLGLPTESGEGLEVRWDSTSYEIGGWMGGKPMPSALGNARDPDLHAKLADGVYARKLPSTPDSSGWMVRTRYEFVNGQQSYDTPEIRARLVEMYRAALAGSGASHMRAFGVPRHAFKLSEHVCRQFQGPGSAWEAYTALAQYKLDRGCSVDQLEESYRYLLTMSDGKLKVWLPPGASSQSITERIDWLRSKRSPNVVLSDVTSTGDANPTSVLVTAEA